MKAPHVSGPWRSTCHVQLALGCMLLGGVLLAGALDDQRLAATGSARLSVDAPGALQEPAAGRDCAILLRAVDWLWRQQKESGGWHGTRCAYLRSGHALTPFVLHALQQAGERGGSLPPARLDAALNFVRASIGPDGAVGCVDPAFPEYPTHASAYALMCLAAAREAQDRPRIAQLRAFLIASQLGEDVGFGPEHVAHGGWGFGPRRPAKGTGHVDLSTTRHALVALRESGGVPHEVARRARVFLGRLQNFTGEMRPLSQVRGPREGVSLDAAVLHEDAVVAIGTDRSGPRGGGPAARATDGDGDGDGGFYFSPIVLAANKGGVEKTPSGAHRQRSYATATCDGLLALYAAGVDLHDVRAQAASAWLLAHSALDAAPGIDPEDPSRWAEALYFYHLAVRAEAHALAGGPPGWRTAIRCMLAPEQDDDGSFVNLRSALMKENDPLLATALAVTALAHTLGVSE